MWFQFIPSLPIPGISVASASSGKFALLWWAVLQTHESWFVMDLINVWNDIGSTFFKWFSFLKFLQVIPCNSWQQEGLSWKPTPGAEGAEGSQSRSWETESSSREHRWVSPALVLLVASTKTRIVSSSNSLCEQLELVLRFSVHSNNNYHDLMELGVILGNFYICLKDWKETYRDIASFVLVCWSWDVFEAASERTLSISAGVLGGSWLMNLDDFTTIQRRPFCWIKLVDGSEIPNNHLKIYKKTL